MIPLTPELVVAAAKAFVGLGEDGGDNRGQMVELFLREVKQPAGQPWCAAFVHHVGYWAHYDPIARQSSWPLPASASCWVLADYALKKEVLVKTPMLGDVFLVKSAKLKRFFHAGLVVGIAKPGPESICVTVEGNTNNDGSANGYTTLVRERSFTTDDRFIRWAELK